MRVSSPRLHTPGPHREPPEPRQGVLIVGADSLFVDAISAKLRSLGLSPIEPPNPGRGGSVDPEPDPVLVLFDADGDHPDANTIARDLPNAKLVWMSATLDADRVRNAIKLGFTAVVSKDITLHRFESALRAVMRGDVVVETDARRWQRRADPEAEMAQLVFASLTAREREILALLVAGATSTEIARQLSVSPHTVRTHVQNVMTKLQVHSRVEAVVLAARHHLLATSTLGSSEVG